MFWPQNPPREDLKEKLPGFSQQWHNTHQVRKSFAVELLFQGSFLPITPAPFPEYG
jgi:hypothetical protein